MKKSHRELFIEETLGEAFGEYAELVEVPLAKRTIIVSGIIFFLVGSLVAGRILMIASQAGAYTKQSAINAAERQELIAPRGLIHDRFGKILAENKPSFLLYLDVKEFLKHPELTTDVFEAVQKNAGLSAEEIGNLLKNAELTQRSGKILLVNDLSQSALIALKSLNLSPLYIEDGFKRYYPYGKTFASVIGYTAAVSGKDLEKDPTLGDQAQIGRTGIEAFYDKVLRGTTGVIRQFRNAHGEAVGDAEVKEPEIGAPLRLTLDAEFQEYFSKRFTEGLRVLGRTTGVGIAINPQTGEILALLNFPGFDHNIFSGSGHNDEKKELLNSPLRPLFNRAISGFYNPGSTIKPLVGVAALKEGVIRPDRTIFSPGYLDVPNPYDPEKPTRFLDWRYQGDVNITSAIAQSSNVYFYTVGGGFGDIKGLGISRLVEWWKKFGLGSSTGVDLPGEADGFLPNPQEKEKKTGRPWLLGDTFNVSIGQGDLLLTPLQIINYISGISTGGIIRRPFLNANERIPEVLADLTLLAPEIKEVQKGMRSAVEAPLGTAYLLKNLPFRVAAKTGSAQIQNNTQENAFFVGYAPAGADEKPQIAILVLIERSREGSLNTLPIAKDTLNWYYEHRVKNEK
ncbi:MAG: penicillin-binding transpeptidase domain-containing protein [Patescibacteria group bacterium]